MANLSPSSFSTTISSINNVANIPAASAPAATLSKELAPQQHYSGEYTNRPVSWHVSGSSPTIGGPAPPVSKLVKKKLMKASNRVKRVVNLDSDHEEDNATAVDEGEAKGMEILLSDDEVTPVSPVSPVSPRVSILGSPMAIKKPKKKKSPKGTSDATLSPKDDETLNNKASLRVKKKAPKKKSINFMAEDSAATTTNNATTNTAHSEVHAISHATAHGDDEDHSLCRDGHHVHRLAHLERSLATVQFERPSSSNYPKGSSPNEKTGHHMRHPSRGILKRAQTMGTGATTGILPGPTSPTRGPLRPSSPIGSMSSDDGGADGYRRRIEAMRNEAGSNWLKVLAEMDKDILPLHTRDDSHL